VEVLRRCWPERFNSGPWQQQLRGLIPGWGLDLGDDPDHLAALRSRSNAALGLDPA